MQRFEGKVAVVTGGTSGIGLAIARRIVSEGGRVVIAGRDAARGEAALQGMAVDSIVFEAADVTDRSKLDHLMAEAVARFGRLDVLVNNAGGTVVGLFSTLKAHHFQKMIDLNLTSVFQASQAALPHLLATIRDQDAPGAAIVNVISVSGMAADRGFPAYNAAKAGALNLTRSMALELAPQRVRVNAVSPGAIDTPLSAPARGSAVLNEAYVAAIPLGRFGQPEEVAAAVAFAAADEAAFMTGSNLVIDGGLMAGTGHPDLIAHYGRPET
jgi:meso-butanediol dehydrogenase/(S,S)-butanediol dehydrogenase/diacetyl reductase